MNKLNKLNINELEQVNGGAIHFDPFSENAEFGGPYEVIDDEDGTIVVAGIETIEDARHWARVFGYSEELI